MWLCSVRFMHVAIINVGEERIDELEMWIVELRNNAEKRAEEDETKRKEEMERLNLVD